MSAQSAYWHDQAAGSRAQQSCSKLPGRWLPALHPGDELLDALIDRAERVLAQHGPLGLVVQLQVHPVDGEVTPLLLRPADELAAQLGPGGLRRDRLGLEDVQVRAARSTAPARCSR